jgi:hypothetical protein
MNPEQKEKLMTHIVEGTFPSQPIFTNEEAKYLVQCALTWASLQVGHCVDVTIPEDKPSPVLLDSYKDKEDAILDTYHYIENSMLECANYIGSWIE